MQEEHVQTCVGAVPDAVVEAFHESSGRFSALGAQPGGRAQVCQDGDGREPPPSPLHLPETRRKGDAWSTVCISCLPRHRAARLELQRDVRSWRGVRDAVMASYVAAPWGFRIKKVYAVASAVRSRSDHEGFSQNLYPR